jgi:hypothetical protein
VNGWQADPAFGDAYSSWWGVKRPLIPENVEALSFYKDNIDIPKVDFL